MKNTAIEYYSSRQGNCAQAVAEAWHLKTGLGTGMKEQFSGCGGGRAPGGLCGALHAALHFIGDVDSEKARSEFAVRSGGHVKCREIRNAAILSCAGCVETAAELADKYGTMS